MENQVEEISSRKLRNEDHVELHEEVKDSVVEAGEEALIIEPLKVGYVAALDDEKMALDYIRWSELTKSIAEKDRQRDALYRGLSDTVKGNLNHFDPAMRVAANALWPIFEFYGDVTRRNFDAETAAVNDFLAELKKPALEAAVKKLGLEGWTTELGVENSRFRALLLERSSETTQKTLLRMKTTRRETDRYYKAITGGLEGQALAGNEAAISLIRTLNDIVARFKNRLAQQEGKKAAQGEAGAEGPDASPVQESPEA